MKVYRESDEITAIRRAIKTELTKAIDRPETELTVVDGMIKDSGGGFSDSYRIDIGEQMTLRAFTEEDGVTSFPVIIVTFDKRFYRRYLDDNIVYKTYIETDARLIYQSIRKKIESQGLDKYW
tara:strand:+ start:646 stop:1014 length:369 start_codon:yes stop_codon:yes gene_type:complete